MIEVPGDFEISYADDGTAEPAPISDLTDRRRILELEAKNAELEATLALLRGEQPGLILQRTGCHHHGGFTVHDLVEKATCNECGADVSPWIILRKIAHRETNFLHTLEDKRKEASKLAKEIERLKAVRQRVRAQIKKEPGGTVLVQHIDWCPTCAAALATVKSDMKG